MLVNRRVSFLHWEIPIIFHNSRNPYIWKFTGQNKMRAGSLCVNSGEMDAWIFFLLSNATPHVPVDFVVLPPRHGRSVTDFWGWDAHEAQLRCPDYVSGDRGGCSARRSLKPKFHLSTQTMVTVGILPFRKNSRGRAGNRTRISWLVVRDSDH